MRLYSTNPGRRTRQITLDVVMLLWLLFALWLGTRVHDAVTTVADQARGVDSAGRSLSSGLASAGDRLDDTPLVGGEIAAPFDRAAESSQGIARAGADTADSIDTLATLAGFGVALILFLIAAPYYLPGRIRFIVVAHLTQRLVARPQNLDLLALRALVRQPLRRLERIDQAAERWRRGDPAAVRALAELEMREAGVRWSDAGSTGPMTGPPGPPPSGPPPGGAAG